MLAGNAPQIDCGVWWGNLDLWGCFGNSAIACDTVRTRPLAGSANSWTFHALPESREKAGGSGCALQTLSPAKLSSNLDARFIVDHPAGVGFPVSYVGGGQPSFAGVHDSGHRCEEAPNLRRGTIEDPDNAGTGLVTSTLAPVNPWLGPEESFTILRVTIGFNWRATTGYENVSGLTDGPWVWGIQK